MLQPFDVLIAGTGPSGLHLAACLAERGVSVAGIGACLNRPWQRSFGTFEGSGVSLELAAAVAHRSASTRVIFPQGDSVSLDLPYIRFDTGRLQQLLTERARARSVHLLEGRVRTENEAILVDTASGSQELTPRLVIDATGQGLQTGTGAQNPSGARAYQSAYGKWIRVRSHSLPLGETRLIDQRDVPGDAGRGDTFLYAIPESSERLFVQETVLCSRLPVPFPQLKQRLDLRLRELGIEELELLEEEHCLIPLGGPLPSGQGRRTLPFGAAARMVQPATGYQLARAWKAAPRLASALAQGLEARLSREELVQLGLEVLWDRDSRRADWLYQRGLDILLAFDTPRWDAFLRAFFNQPEALIAGFMEGTLSASEVTSCMWNVFVRAPMGLRVELLRGSARSLGRFKPSLTREAP